jgi:hypothetical protein
MGVKQSTIITTFNDEIAEASDSLSKTNDILKKYVQKANIDPIMLSIEDRHKDHLRKFDNKYIYNYLKYKDILDIDEQNNVFVLSRIKELGKAVSEVIDLMTTNSQNIGKEIMEIVKKVENHPDFTSSNEFALNPNILEFLEDKKINMSKWFNMFFDSYGLTDDGLEKQDVAVIFTYELSDIIAKLKDKVENSSDNNFISFTTVLAYIGLHLRIAENIVTEKINSRVKRHMESVVGWNAFYACLWHKFKKDNIDLIKNSLEDLHES